MLLMYMYLHNRNVFMFSLHLPDVGAKVKCLLVVSIAYTRIHHLQHKYNTVHNAQHYGVSCTKVHEYTDTQKEKERQQHNTRPETTFSKEKAALRWDSNPRLTHFWF